MRLLLSVLGGAVVVVAYAWYRSTHPATVIRRRGSDPTDLVVRSLRVLPVALGIAAQFPRPGSVAPIIACIPAATGLLRHVAIDRRSRVYAATSPLLFLALALFLWLSAVGESVAVYGWFAWGGAVLVLVAAIATTRPSFEETTAALIDGIGWYLLFSVLLFVATGTESRVAAFRPKTHTLFGTSRVIWPLASSAQEPSIIAALYLVSNAATKRLAGRASDVMRACFFCSAIAVWMFADDRFAVLATVATLVAAARFVPRRVRATGVLCLVMLCIPWWWASASSVLSVAARNATSISRTGNASDLLTLNNRSNVWAASKAVLGESNNRHVLAGYGLRGQRASGASARYAKYFGSYGDPLAASTHNSMLQLLLDQGLVGLGVEGVAIGLAFAALFRRARRRPGDIAGLGMLRLLGLLLAASAAEGVLSASFAQLPFWLLIVVLAIVATDDRAPEHEVNLNAAARPEPIASSVP